MIKKKRYLEIYIPAEGDNKVLRFYSNRQNDRIRYIKQSVAKGLGAYLNYILLDCAKHKVIYEKCDSQTHFRLLTAKAAEMEKWRKRK